MRTNNSFIDAEVREAIAAAIKELEEKEKQEIKEVRKIYKLIDKIIKEELIKEIKLLVNNINKEINSAGYWRNGYAYLAKDYSNTWVSYKQRKRSNSYGI